MKKILSFMAILLAVSAFNACNRAELKQCAGKIKELSDTTMVVKVGGYDIKFDTKAAQYDNGFVMPGDSISITYVGDLREKMAKAALVHLVPKKGKYVDAVYDPSKPLETSDEELTEEEQVNRQKFLENAKRHGH